MEIITKKILPREELRYFENLEHSLFFDIETTGFSRQTCICYLIGVMFLEKGEWYIEQYFATNFQEEAEVLQAFLDKTRSFDCLISFNGDGFDIPFIKARMDRWKISSSLSVPSVDILKILRKGNFDLPVPNLKLKTLEQFAGVYRQDQYSGGDLIGMYFRYVKSKEESLKQNILLHNFEDIENMLILDKIMYMATGNDSEKSVGKKQLRLQRFSISGSDLKLELELKNPMNRLFFTDGVDSVSVQGKEVYIKFHLQKNSWKDFSILYTDRMQKPYLKRMQVENHPMLPPEWIIFSVDREISRDVLETAAALFLEDAEKKVQ